MSHVHKLHAATAAAAVCLIASTALSIVSAASVASLRDGTALQREQQSQLPTAEQVLIGQATDTSASHDRHLLHSRTRRERRPRRSGSERPRRPRRGRRAGGGSPSTPPPPDPPMPDPPTPPPSPPPPDNPGCPEAPVNLWINELVWRVNGPGEFVEIAGPPGVSSDGWLIGECDQGDGSEGPQTQCRGTLRAIGSDDFILQPAPPLQESGGLSIGSVEIDVRPGTDQGIGLINPCGQLIHAVVYAGTAGGNQDDNEQNDNLEALDADFFPLGTSMSLTGQGTVLSAFTFAVAAATPGAVNTGQNSGPALPTLPTPPTSCDGLAPLWINEINQDRDNEGEFWEVAAAPGADGTGWSIARCQERTSEGITRPVGCGTSRVPIPPLRESAGGLLVASESTTLRNIDSREQGLGLFNPCGELTQLVTFDGDLLREVDGVEAVVLEDFLLFEDVGSELDPGRSYALVGQGSAFEDFEFTVVDTLTPGESNPGQSLST